MIIYVFEEKSYRWIGEPHELPTHTPFRVVVNRIFGD